jgi:hypothetical protein
MENLKAHAPFVGMVRAFQRVLGIPLTPEAELYALSMEQLRKLIDELQDKVLNAQKPSQN